MRLLREHVADLPVTAVLSTHSHADHFGGIEGVADRADVEAGRVRYVVPADFVEESVSENVLAGTVMGRRASYMYGNAVSPGPQGAVGAGLGPSTSAGSIALYPPTDIVDHTPQEMVIDGVRFVFQHTPGAEAPAEYCFYLPDHQALCMAEIASHTLHNLYTLRGAKVRDALAWSKHIHEALRLFGRQAQVLFASHHWPTWGNEALRAQLVGQRDLYRYLHDQTLRLANHGHGPAEIAEMLTLPDGIASRFANRGYYGSVRRGDVLPHDDQGGGADGARALDGVHGGDPEPADRGSLVDGPAWDVALRVHARGQRHPADHARATTWAVALARRRLAGGPRHGTRHEHMLTLLKQTLEQTAKPAGGAT